MRLSTTFETEELFGSMLAYWEVCGEAQFDAVEADPSVGLGASVNFIGITPKQYIRLPRASRKGIIQEVIGPNDMAKEFPLLKSRLDRLAHKWVESREERFGEQAAEEYSDNLEAAMESHADAKREARYYHD